VVRDAQIQVRALLLFEQLVDEPASREQLLRSEPGDVLEALRKLEKAAPRARSAFPTVDDAAPVRTLLPLPERVAPYRLTELLGEGGMGLVFAAERDDGLFEQKVAVKLIHPDCFTPRALTRFAEERRMLARVEHPGVARLIDGGVADGWPYIVMERVTGLPIDDYAAGKGLTTIERVRLVEQLCHAVASAHAALVAHGDIKPSNVLVEAGGRARLLDFGVASLVDEPETALQSPLTVEFASPERRAGGQPSVRDDIYALGVLLGRLVTGERPSSDLTAIAAKATATDPAARYQSADALAADLARWLNRLPVEAHPKGVAYVLGKFILRNRRVLAGGVIALALVLGAAGLAWYNWRQANERIADVRRLSNYMLFDVYDRLASQPGTARQRAEVAAQAAEYLDRLRVSRDASPELRLEAARAYRRLAAVQGLPGTPNLGMPEKSRASLNRALELLDGGAARTAPILGERGWGKLDLWALKGEGAASLKLIASARTDLAAALALDPQSQSARLGEIVATGDEAYDLVWTMDQPAKAVGKLRGALAALRRTNWPAELHGEAMRTEIRLLSWLGDATYYAGDVAGSLGPYREQASLIAAAIAREGATPQLIILEGENAFNLAGVLADLPGGLDEALRVTEQGIKPLRALLDYGPDAAAEKKLLVLYGEQADLLQRKGLRTQAIAASRASVTLREQRLARSPGDYQRLRDLAIGLPPYVELLGSAKRTSEACHFAQQALDAWARITAAGKLGALDARKNQPNAARLRARYCAAAAGG
jgi:serine/threonine-protein kinase